MADKRDLIGAGVGTFLGLLVSTRDAIKDTNLQALIARTIEAAEKGKYVEALSHASHAISMYPKEAYVYAIRGYVYSLSGNYDEAIKDSSQAIEIDNSQVDFLAIRGWSYFEKNDLGNAIRDFTHIVQLQPSQYYGYFWRGIALRLIGDFEQALANFSRAIELQPGDEGIYRQRGIAYADMGEHQKAIADYSRAIALNPNSSEDFKLRGEAYRMLGDEARGVADFGQATGIEETRARTEAEKARQIAEERAREEEQKASVISGPKQGGNDTWICSACEKFVRRDAEFCKHCGRTFRKWEEVVISSNESRMAPVINAAKVTNAPQPLVDQIYADYVVTAEGVEKSVRQELKKRYPNAIMVWYGLGAINLLCLVLFCNAGYSLFLCSVLPILLAINVIWYFYSYKRTLRVLHPILDEISKSKPEFKEFYMDWRMKRTERMYNRIKTVEAIAARVAVTAVGVAAAAMEHNKEEQTRQDIHKAAEALDEIKRKID